MSSHIFFDPVLPLSFSVIVIIALTILFLWIEWRKKTILRPIRLLAMVTLMLSVAGLLFRPTLRGEANGGVILLTEDYSPVSVDSLRKEYPALKLIHLPGLTGYKNSTVLQSVHDLATYKNEIAFVIGNGLSPEQLELVEPARFEFVSGPEPEGIVNLTLPKQVFANRINVLSGVLNNRTESKKLILEGPGGKEDSAVIEGKGPHTFQLAFTPRESGRFVYQLKDGSSIEQIPLVVNEETPLKILFVQHYPTFETRQLKELLAKKHQLIFRYQLSQNKYRHEFINTSTRPINRLNEKILADFDLLVIDSDGLKDLSSVELTSLRRTVQSGLGVLILFNELPSQKLARNLLPIKFIKTRADTAHVFVPGYKDAMVIQAWPQSPQSTTPVIGVVQNQNRTLSGYIPEGFGKIGFQLLQQTYQLALQGDSLRYSALWSSLVEKTARKKTEDMEVHFDTPFPFAVNTPIAFRVFTSDITPTILLNNENIPLMENFWIDNIWHGKIWPGTSGWHSFESNGVTVSQFYLSEAGSWKSLSAMRNINETKRRQQESTQQQTTIIEKEIPEWIFFIIFLFSAAFLWLAPKL